MFPQSPAVFGTDLATPYLTGIIADRHVIISDKPSRKTKS